MDPERWKRVETVFHRALAANGDERAALLERECDGDDELRRQVERLIDADATPHALVERFDEGALLPVGDPLVGRTIGAYRLTSRIAAGGMGVVYRAERSDGLFEREVAIKLIRIELATDALVRRFELERRTLAALQHPHIAALTDGGTTEDGRPYLVMQFVRGLAIDRWCDERRASIADRLRLCAEVCRAVHYAHQNLIVHRDLKPANILIDEQGAPKLLDFGIARLLDGALPAGAAERTRTLGQALTPDYASPEQFTLGPVTTAMDVYSLGVVLYELLTGRRPFPSENQNPVEWQRAVLERPPTRPSKTALWLAPAPAPGPSAPQRVDPDEIAARRGLTPRGLRRRLRGDLDRIVLMALRKEPERRYASAKDLADDIERHLSGHPIQARRDSFAYRASKFVRRNRVVVGSGVALVLALAWGIVSANRGEREAREQAQHARIEAQSFESISGFLMDAFLTSAPTIDGPQRDAQRRRILMHAERVRREHADEDHLRANLLDSLGRVAQRLGLSDSGLELALEARSIRARAFGEQSLEYALSLRTLGHMRFENGELAPATELLAGALAIHRASPPGTHTDVASAANDLAACLRGLGRLDEAVALHREALALRRADDPDSLHVAESLNNLASVDIDQGDIATAAERIEESLTIRRRILGNEDPLTLQSASNLAAAVWRLDQRERANALLTEVEAGYRALRVDGEEPLAHVLSNHAAMSLAAGDLAGAEALLAEALALQVRRLGERHPSVATTLGRRAQLEQAQGRKAQARATWEQVVAIRREPNASPLYLAQSLYDQGSFLVTIAARDEARAAFQESVDVLRATGGARSPLAARAELLLGEVLFAQGDAASAAGHLDAAIAIATEAPAGLEAVLERARAARQRCAEARGQ